MKKGIRCNYIPNMKALAQVLIGRKKKKKKKGFQLALKLKPKRIMFFIPKRRPHSAILAFNLKKGIRCNYIPNMKSLAQICQLALKL